MPPRRAWLNQARHRKPIRDNLFPGPLLMYDIYSNANADAWRFALGKSGKRPLLAVALNPSTATREKSDPTVARVEEVARRNGFDGFVMFNLYPVRATDYRELSPKVNAAAYKANLGTIEELVARQTRPSWSFQPYPGVPRSRVAAANVAMQQRLGAHR